VTRWTFGNFSLRLPPSSSSSERFAVAVGCTLQPRLVLKFVDAYVQLVAITSASLVAAEIAPSRSTVPLMTLTHLRSPTQPPKQPPELLRYLYVLFVLEKTDDDPRRGRRGDGWHLYVRALGFVDALAVDPPGTQLPRNSGRSDGAGAFVWAARRDDGRRARLPRADFVRRARGRHAVAYALEE